MLRITQSLHYSSVASLLLNLVGWPWPPNLFLYALPLTITFVAGLTAFAASFRLALRLVFENPPREP